MCDAAREYTAHAPAEAGGTGGATSASDTMMATEHSATLHTTQTLTKHHHPPHTVIYPDMKT